MATNPKALNSQPRHAASASVYRLEEQFAALEHEEAKEWIALQHAEDAVKCWRQKYIECQETNCELQRELRELRIALKKTLGQE